MPETKPQTYTVFAGGRRVATGSLTDVALAAKAAIEQMPEITTLVFDDTTGTVIDLDLRGSAAEIAARYAALTMAEETAFSTRGRGRPKLGVIAREVTLLPRHWDWLAAQPGGASQALRRLVDEARHADGGRTERRRMQEAAYRFMAAVAGDLPGFEMAARALFAADQPQFSAIVATWPQDISSYAQKLAWGEPAAASAS